MCGDWKGLREETHCVLSQFDTAFGDGHQSEEITESGTCTVEEKEQNVIKWHFFQTDGGAASQSGFKRTFGKDETVTAQVWRCEQEKVTLRLCIECIPSHCYLKLHCAEAIIENPFIESNSL